MVCESTVLLSHCQLLSPSSWVTFSESVLYAEWCSPCDPLPPYQSIGIWTEKLLQIASVSLFSCCCCLVAKSYPNLLWPQGLQTTRILCLWEFPRQEYFSGLSLPSPGDLPDPGIKPASPTLAGTFFTTESPGKSLSEELPTETQNFSHSLLVLKWRRAT